MQDGYKSDYNGSDYHGVGATYYCGYLQQISLGFWDGKGACYGLGTRCSFGRSSNKLLLRFEKRTCYQTCRCSACRRLNGRTRRSQLLPLLEIHVSSSRFNPSSTSSLSSPSEPMGLLNRP